MKTIRIFISSPGDVQEERERARGVALPLRLRYAGRLEMPALWWEELPLGRYAVPAESSAKFWVRSMQRSNRNAGV